MSRYESTFIFSPELPTEKVEELIQKIQKNVEGSEGTISLSQNLGRRKLAYPIRKFREGNYVYFEYTGSGKTVATIENFCKVTDTVIRYMTVKNERKEKKVEKAPVEKKQEVEEHDEQQQQPEASGTK